MSKQHPRLPTTLRPLSRNTRDPLTRSWFIQRLIGGMPLKSRAKNRALVYRALNRVRRECGVSRPALVLVHLVHHMRPHSWVRHIRRGKRDYRIPYSLHDLQQYRVGLRWLVRAFKSSDTPNLSDRLFNEMSQVISGKSRVFAWKRNLRAAIIRNRHNYGFFDPKPRDPSRLR